MGLGDRSPSTSTRSSARRATSTSARRCPTAPLRGYVMGERGGDHTEVPTTDEIAAMGAPRRRGHRGRRARLLDLAHGHPPVRRAARHTPSAHRDRRRAARHRPRHRRDGLGVFEVVADLDDLDARVRADPRDVRGQRSARCRSPCLQQPEPPPTSTRGSLGLIDAAVADGVPMRGQVADPSRRPDHEPRRPGPPVRRVTDLPGARRPAARRARGARCATPSVRAQRGDRAPRPAPRSARSPTSRAVFPLGDPPRYDPRPTRPSPPSPTRRAAPVSTSRYDVMLADGRHGKLYLPVIELRRRRRWRATRRCSTTRTRPRPRRRAARTAR